MKFNCGPTAEVKAARKHKALQEWHTHFAWWPVRVGGGGTECRWLEFVYRKGTYTSSMYDCDYWTWTYMPIPEDKC